MLILLSATTNTAEVKEGWGGLIVIGLFIIALLIALIWWLNRG